MPTKSIETNPEKSSINSELLNISPVHKLFADLSQPERAVNITAQEIEKLRGPMRKELETVGVDFKSIESPQMQALLTKRKFRFFDSGKGLAISTAISPSFIAKYQGWAMSESVDLPKLTEGDETSRCRGLMQLMANTIAYAAGAITSENYLIDLKWRIGASYERPLKKETEKASEGNKPKLRQKLDSVRSAYSIPTPDQKDLRHEYSDYSRVKPESAVQFWGQLKQLCSQK